MPSIKTNTPDIIFGKDIPNGISRNIPQRGNFHISHSHRQFCRDSLHSLCTLERCRVTRNALSQLSLRELNDIGLVPGDIERIARAKARPAIGKYSQP